MPATNFLWSMQDSAAMFHTLGMKRKCPESEVPDSKRPCPSMVPEKCNSQMINMTPESNMQCDGDNERSSMDTELISDTKENRVPDLHPDYTLHVSAMPNERGCDLNSNSIHIGADQEMGDNNNNTNNTNGAITDMYSQTSMIMDLQDECYSTAVLPENVMTDVEYEAACNMVAAMESEGAPDPSQYRYSYTNSSIIRTLQISPSMTNTSSIPVTNLSPEVRPYVSDYY